MSELKSVRWNAVVAGKWNPAILSPKGIATHIFNKKDDYPVEVLVPINAQGPPIVAIEGLKVLATFDRLSIDCDNSDWEFLEKAMNSCCDAIDALPITPLVAAGFNIRYELRDPDLELIESLELPLDDKISEQGLTIAGKEIVRSIKWKDGVINLQIKRGDADSYEIALNFDRKSTDNNELKEWLKLQTNSIKKIVTTILCTIIGACEEGEI